MQGLGRMEMDNLRDWEAKFNFKYPIAGSLVKGVIPATMHQQLPAVRGFIVKGEWKRTRRASSMACGDKVARRQCPRRRWLVSFRH